MAKSKNSIQYSIIDPPKSHFDDKVISENKINANLKTTIFNAVHLIQKQIKPKIRKVWIIGSSLTYQWKPESDIDVTLFVDDLSDEGLITLNKFSSENYNEKIYIDRHPINFHFITGEYDHYRADAIYNLSEDKWIKKPRKSNYEDIEKLIHVSANSSEFKSALENYLELQKMIDKYNGSQEALKDIIQKAFEVNNLYEKIRDARREDFKSMTGKENKPSANYNKSNVIFKLLEKEGLDSLESQISELVFSSLYN